MDRGYYVGEICDRHMTLWRQTINIRGDSGQMALGGREVTLRGQRRDKEKIQVM